MDEQLEAAEADAGRAPPGCFLIRRGTRNAVAGEHRFFFFFKVDVLPK